MVKPSSERVPFPIIVGCGRSGTTLVRAMLDAHPLVAVPDESYFPVWLGRHRARYEDGHDFALDRLIRDINGHESRARWGLDADGVRAALEAAAPRTFADAVRAYYAYYAQTRGKARYADKTPIFVLHMPLLASLFPEAIFVHLVRDGRDVALSRLETSWGTQRFDHEALQWRSHIEQGRRDGRALGPGRYMELHYEALLDDPERAAVQLCEFSCIPYDDRMLHYYEQSQSLVNAMEFPEEHRNLLRPPTKGLRDWRTDLRRTDAEVFDALAGPTLERFGYERSRARRSSSELRARVLEARLRYLADKWYRNVRSLVWRAVHPDGRLNDRPDSVDAVATSDGGTVDSTKQPVSLRHRATGLVPMSVRRWPYQAADAVEGRRDVRRLKAGRPDVARALARDFDDAELRRAYDDYVNTISQWDWAVSWPTARALNQLCAALRPRRVLDLGSGFSTFVICSWAKDAETATEVVSVDDSPEWLEKTAHFLEGHGLDATLISPDGLAELPPSSFDLCFDDIGRIEVRASVIGDVLRLMSPGGVVVLDDMNVRGYRGKVREQLVAAGWDLYSIRSHTIDRKGRFAMIASARGKALGLDPEGP
jgi:predicted O-methyltransferase YrrM